ncbi:MAG: hypothetical protein J6N78_04080 [Clostridia bacterium]|nr:hypothetical protein [Clostridia bacterium]
MTFYELRHFENLERLSRVPVSQSAAENITGIIIPANVLAIVNPTGIPQPDGILSTDINYILDPHSSLDHIVFMYDYDAQKAQDGEYYAIDQYDLLEFSASTMSLYTGKVYINNAITTTGGFQKLLQAFPKVTENNNWVTYDGYYRNGLPMIAELFRNYEETETEWIKRL